MKFRELLVEEIALMILGVLLVSFWIGVLVYSIGGF